LGQKSPQPSEDTPEVVSDGGEDGIGSVSGTTFEIAAAEVTFSFEVADHGLDGRTSSQLAFDGAEDAALLSRDEDAAWIWRIVPAIALVDIAALDLAAGELLGNRQRSGSLFRAFACARRSEGSERGCIPNAKSRGGFLSEFILA
jgi:hypothetical protein